MTHKQCKTCKELLPVSAFYKHSECAGGVLPSCKECHKANMRANRSRRIEYYREYDRKRYRSDPERKAKVARRFKKRQKSCPAALKATRMVSNAIRDGRLIREPCEVCGDPKSEAHHPDYAKPLSVMWLCRSHHIKWHLKSGPGKNADIDVDEIDVAA